MSEMKSISLVVEETVTSHLDQLESRDKYHQRKIKDQRKLIEDLKRQVREFTAYVHSGKQQIDMINLAKIIGKFDRETHLLEIVKLVPAIKPALCANLQYLLPWVHPMWVETKVDLITGEDYAKACIALESLIMEAERKDIDGSSSE